MKLKLSFTELLIVLVLGQGLILGFTLPGSITVGFLLAYNAYKTFLEQKNEELQQKLSSVVQYEERIKSLESRISALGLVRKV